MPENSTGDSGSKEGHLCNKEVSSGSCSNSNVRNLSNKSCSTEESCKAQYKVMWNSILPLPSLSNQVFSGNSEVELSFVSSFAPVKNNQFKLWQFSFFKKINQPTLEKPTNNNPPSPPVLCNIKWSVPVQELPAPSGTLGKGQLRAQHSSRAREGWGEPGSSFPCVPGKAGAWLEGLLRGSFLSPCCCHAGRYLGPGRKRRKKKQQTTLSILNKQSICPATRCSFQGLCSEL